VPDLPDEEKDVIRSWLHERGSDHLAGVAEELHRRYHRLIYYFLRIFRLPDDQLDDLFNQIFVKILKGLGGIRHARNIKAWVVTIAKNEIFSFINKRDRELSVWNSYEDMKAWQEGGPRDQNQRTPERLIHDKQLVEVFEESLARLEPELSRPFLMRYRDNMRWKEIGDALNLNEDTARKRSDRARSIIRQYMKRRLRSNFPTF
jgi:RNA polymerase sigma-70 factor, ECF subfamily